MLHAYIREKYAKIIWLPKFISHILIIFSILFTNRNVPYIRRTDHSGILSMPSFFFLFLHILSSMLNNITLTILYLNDVFTIQFCIFRSWCSDQQKICSSYICVRQILPIMEDKIQKDQLFAQSHTSSSEYKPSVY